MNIQEIKHKTLTELADRMPESLLLKAEAVVELCPELWVCVQKTVEEAYDLGFKDGQLSKII